MASPWLPPPSATSSPSANSSTVTQEQFNLFHNIDRHLFTRLIRGLRRDPGQSMQAMALWMWLEQTRQCRDLVANMLKWPDTLIAGLADEAALCLNCIESEEFNLLPLENNMDDVPFTRIITENRVSLRFFRDNRFNILLGITKILNEVCARAFEDIIQRHAMEKNAVVDHNTRSENLRREEILAKQQQQQYHHHHLSHLGPVIYPVLPPVMHHNIGVGGHLGHHHTHPHHPMPSTTPQYFDQGFDVYDVAAQGQIFNNEIGERLSGIHITPDHHDHDHQQQQQENNDEPPPSDERTIFLTFSKGYPISETEIREFFSSIYGECIEAICMQEVEGEEQQPLYARLVVDSVSTIEVILEGKSKAKFSINGKHVWARKYVRKNNKSPSRSSSPITTAILTSSPPPPPPSQCS